MGGWGHAFLMVGAVQDSDDDEDDGHTGSSGVVQLVLQYTPIARDVEDLESPTTRLPLPLPPPAGAGTGAAVGTPSGGTTSASDADARSNLGTLLIPSPPSTEPPASGTVDGLAAAAGRAALLSRSLSPLTTPVAPDSPVLTEMEAFPATARHRVPSARTRTLPRGRQFNSVLSAMTGSSLSLGSQLSLARTASMGGEDEDGCVAVWQHCALSVVEAVFLRLLCCRVLVFWCRWWLLSSELTAVLRTLSIHSHDSPPHAAFGDWMACRAIDYFLVAGAPANHIEHCIATLVRQARSTSTFGSPESIATTAPVAATTLARSSTVEADAAPNDSGVSADEDSAGVPPTPTGVVSGADGTHCVTTPRETRQAPAASRVCDESRGASEAGGCPQALVGKDGMVGSPLSAATATPTNLSQRARDAALTWWRRSRDMMRRRSLNSPTTPQSPRGQACCSGTPQAAGGEEDEGEGGGGGGERVADATMEGGEDEAELDGRTASPPPLDVSLALQQPRSTSTSSCRSPEPLTACATAPPQVDDQTTATSVAIPSPQVPSLPDEPPATPAVDVTPPERATACRRTAVSEPGWNEAVLLDR